MYSLITDTWNDYLLQIPINKRDIYYTEEYVKLYEGPFQKALCYVYSNNKHILLMPYICSKIDSVFYDFETPYGYGGPITNCTDDIWILTALSEMKIFFMQKHYIAGLIRFHPLLDNENFCREVLSTGFERTTVFIDLSFSMNDIWNFQFSSKNRNTIRKAEKTGLTFVTDFNLENIEIFIQLYNTTMNRLHAGSFFYFTEDYYSKFKTNLKDNSCLGIVKKDGYVIAAAIFMYYSDYGHYHLAGSDKKYSSYGVNNFLLWNMVKTLKEKGIKRFHLGGGTNSDPDNSLFRFKESFSNNKANYYIGKLIFNEEKYKELCTVWEQNNPGKIGPYKNKLLKYRY